MRVAARLKVKKSKCLHKVPIFSGLSDAGVEALLNHTKYSKAKRGTVLCQEGDAADEFFVVVNGSIAVTVQQPAPPGSAGEEPGSLIEFRVGTLRAFDVAGENAVVGVLDRQGTEARLRDATLTVESDTSEVLRLPSQDWRKLLESGVMGEDIMSGVESGLAQREKDNIAAMAEARQAASAGAAEVAPPSTREGEDAHDALEEQTREQGHNSTTRADDLVHA